MSLSTNVTLTVSDYDIKLSRNLKFYENDQLKLIFTLNYWGIDNAKGSSQRVLMPLNALTAILFIETPLGVDTVESATIEENVVTFYLTSNQTQYIGISRMQIQLLDEDGCQVTLPPMNFEVRENIYGNEVMLSKVLLSDENENIIVDENDNAINTGTKVSAQTYAVALSEENGSETTTSQPTKQIKDFNLKTGASGEEDLLIQDSDGATKRIKASEFLNVNVDLTLYCTKEEVNTLLNNKANISHTHTVADIEDMPDYALKTDIPTVPTKTSELTNDTGFITTIPTEYITESELNEKGYLTEHQDISMKADKTELHSHDNKTVLDSITETKITEWNNKSDFDGNYNSLTNKPNIPTVDVNKNYVDTQLATKANKSEIPSLDGYATETYVQNKIEEAALSGGEVDLSSYATKDELSTKADISSIPTKTSQLNNDSGFITSVPSEYITESELDAKGYLTEHQDITGKADKIYVDTELAKKANVSHDHSYNDLTDKPTIPSVDNLATKEELTNSLATKANKSEIPSLEGYATEIFVTNKIAEASLSGGEVDLSGLATKAELATKADKTAIPTKTSQLTNDSGFLTEHQNISSKADKTYVDNQLATKSNTDHTHSYNDLTDKPTIPSTTNLATKTELTDGLATKSDKVHTHDQYLTEHQDISGKANISDLSAVATSGNYNDLINTPTIPKEYALPIATPTTLGGIKVGSGLSIDTDGVLSATGTGGTDTGETVGNGIIFNDTYATDCNRWLTNGYVKTRPDTSNLPALCTDVARWGVLFFIAENATDGTGTQMFFPIDGTYKGRVFTRSLTGMSHEGQASEWVLLAIQSDIPSIDGLATETYVNNKMIPNLVGKTVENRTLTLTVDKYQYAVLSNGDSVVLPSVSSFTEIHLFFKASADLTLTFPSVRWQSIPSITSGHTYEIIFTYVVDEWLAGVICYE